MEGESKTSIDFIDRIEDSSHLFSHLAFFDVISFHTNVPLSPSIHRTFDILTDLSINRELFGEFSHQIKTM